MFLRPPQQVLRPVLNSYDDSIIYLWKYICLFCSLKLFKNLNFHFRCFLFTQIMDDFLWEILYNKKNESAKENPVVKEPDEK